WISNSRNPGGFARTETRGIRNGWSRLPGRFRPPAPGGHRPSRDVLAVFAREPRRRAASQAGSSAYWEPLRGVNPQGRDHLPGGSTPVLVAGTSMAPTV